MNEEKTLLKLKPITSRVKQVKIHCRSTETKPDPLTIARVITPSQHVNPVNQQCFHFYQICLP